MRTRLLGNTELELTVMGLGTWAIGGSWQFGWGPQDQKDSIATILRAFELGINWIDTAAIYGCGDSEIAVGKALRVLKEKPIVATKCGIRWTNDRKAIRCIDHDSILAECDQSLKRLGLDVIDLYQIHWPTPDGKIEQAWEAMVKLKDAGKVRYIGVSNFSVSQLERICRIHPVASLQPPYSMLKRDIENEILGYCKKNTIGVVCYSPLQKGLLTGRMTAERIADLAPDDHRHNDPDFTEPRLSTNLELIERLKPIADRNGRTLSQLAISWVLRRPEITSAIVGARRPQQLDETVRAVDWQLGADEQEEIEHLLC